jgi:ATP-dependent Lon protease
LPSYTHHEKLMIARRHLLPRQLAENGLIEETLTMSDDILSLVIGEYTREAGVRSLERKIGALCRARAAAIVRGEPIKAALTADQVRAILGPLEYESEVAATHAKPGVVTGLAFTPVGGDILFIEARQMPGSGQLILTGQLGDVMRESARAALSIIRSHTGRWRVSSEDIRKNDLHVHVPAGAIPKDGPSAGVAMLAAMTSALSGRSVDPTFGMTGEITLSGRVLPVGGIREKVLAAHRAGLKAVLLPDRNQRDLEELPADVRASMRFVPLTSIDDMYKALFLSKGSTKTSTARKPKSRRPRART